YDGEEVGGGAVRGEHGPGFWYHGAEAGGGAVGGVVTRAGLEPGSSGADTARMNSMRRVCSNLLRGAGSREIWPMPPRRQPPAGPEGLRSDWLAVGTDLRRSMERHADMLTPYERRRFLSLRVRRP